jgi:hypothetical protein
MAGSILNPVWMARVLGRALSWLFAAERAWLAPAAFIIAAFALAIWIGGVMETDVRDRRAAEADRFRAECERAGGVVYHLDGTVCLMDGQEIASRG